MRSPPAHLLEVLLHGPLLLGYGALDGRGEELDGVALGPSAVALGEVELHQVSSNRGDGELCGGSLRRVFDRIDLDGSGSLDKKEIWAAVRRLRIPVKWTEFERTFNTIDLDGSGEIDFEEFCDLFKNQERLNFGGPVPWGE